MSRWSLPLRGHTSFMKNNTTSQAGERTPSKDDIQMVVSQLDKDLISLYRRNMIGIAMLEQHIGYQILLIIQSRQNLDRSKDWSFGDAVDFPIAALRRAVFVKVTGENPW